MSILARIATLPILLLSFAIVDAFAAERASAATRGPNVVVILTDDQGWGDLSASGNTDLYTPNIDSLARDGVSPPRTAADAGP